MLSPFRPCATPGCPELVHRGHCARHARQLEQGRPPRPNRAARRWYFTAPWRRLRAQVLEEQPLCLECLKANELVRTVDVDHIVPHAGDYERFFDRENLQGLCKMHHTQKTRAGQ